MTRLRFSSLLVLTLIGSTLALADDPPKLTPPVKVEDPLKPLPPAAIPDDPPPHEGAMIDIPYIIEPPDIVIVEVLEALPARPITGERVVRPDGTISLGFYGDVHVRGLTLQQIKVKVLLHMREFLNDEVLGLVIPVGGEPGPQIPSDMVLNSEPTGGQNPFRLIPKSTNPPGFLPEIVPPVEKKPDQEVKPAEKPDPIPKPKLSRRDRSKRDRGRTTRRARFSSRSLVNRSEQEQDPKPPPQIPGPPRPFEDGPLAEHFRKLPLQGADAAGQIQVVEPIHSRRAFVDISSYNSKVYFVQGDVGVPGRLPWTGKETVLDALNYAGGFVATAEPTDIHLYRPARGGKPVKDYRIDLDAIHKGVKTANLQIFPDDRLVIGRNPIVKKTVEIDRANALINTQLNTILQYGFTARAMGAINISPTNSNTTGQVRVNGQNMPLNQADPLLLTPDQRDAMIKDWAEFLWSISSKEGGAMLDEKAFKEALMKKLTPAPAPEPKP